MLNIKKLINGLRLMPKSSSTIDSAGEMEVLSTDGRLRINDGSTTSRVVTETQESQGANRLQNKDLDDESTAVVNTIDTTKKIQFNASGTTGTSTTLLSSQTANRVLTLPDTTDTLATVGSSQVLTNKKLDDSTVYFVDTGDNTKEFHFDAAGTAGTKTTLAASQTSNRTINLPDASTTLVGTDTVDSLTNKVLIDVGNLELTGNTISSTDTDGNINLSPNGTGDVVIDQISVSESSINDVSGITGIVGGSLTVQSASGQNLSLLAIDAGSAIISGTDVQVKGTVFTSNTITGASGSTFTVQADSSQNLALKGGSGGNVTVPSNPLVLSQNLETLRADDSSTTGSQATLSAFTTGFVKVTNNSLSSLSAIPAGADGQQLILSNETGNSFIINNEDTGVTAANRILTGTGALITVNNNSSISLIYDTGNSRWKVFGGAGGGAVPTTFGSRLSPKNITAGTGLAASASNMSTTATEQLIFVQGNGGPVTITASPAIQAGTQVGQKMILIGRSDSNTVTINNSTAQVELNGNVTLGWGDSISLIYDGTCWTELGRS